MINALSHFVTKNVYSENSLEYFFVSGCKKFSRDERAIFIVHIVISFNENNISLLNFCCLNRKDVYCKLNILYHNCQENARIFLRPNFFKL
jgi:hypothetical protein